MTVSYTHLKVLHQLAAAQSNADILCHHKVVIRRDIEGKAKFQPLPLAFGGRGYLQLFQLLAAALCHFGGGSPHKVSRNIIFQLFRLFHIGVVLLLPQGVSRLPLGQIGGIIALVNGKGCLLYTSFHLVGGAFVKA